MATEHPTLTVVEAHRLADRLYSRSASKLSAMTEEEKRDVETAVKVIRTLLADLPADHAIKLY